MEWRTVFLDHSGDDFDEASEVFGESFNLPAIRFTPTVKNFRWRNSAVGDDELSFQKTLVLAQAEAIVDTGAEFVVVWIMSGRTTFGEGRTALSLTPRIPVVMPNGSSISKAISIDADQNMIHINTEFLRSVAEELDGDDFGTFDVVSPVTEQALALWRRTVHLVGSVLRDPSVPASSLLQREMSRLVAVTMLTTFPYRSTTARPGTVGPEPASVRLALEYVEQNAHLPIGPVDVAHAAGLSVRSLQYALRRYRETTPTALLQAVRLDRVHAELAAAEPGTGTVAATARRWGFVHLGRFSSSYRARFGQLPNQTLRSFR